MPTIIDTLVTKFVLDAKDYDSKADKIAQASQRMSGGITGVVAKVASLQAILTGGAVTLLGVAASKAAVDLESLKLGLTAVSGSAAEMEKQFARLKEVAKLPGLGLEEAVRASIGLQSAGLSANLAERAIAGFGNALATVGRGKAELDGVILALGQIQSKGVVSAEEINQIAERVPQIRKLMEGAFGTSNTEALQGMGIKSEAFISAIVAQLERLPKVAGGSKNTLENLGDSWQAILAGIGKAINSVAMPALEKVGNFLAYIGNSGIIDKIGAKFTAAFKMDLGDLLIKGLAKGIAVIDKIPETIKAISAGFRSVIDHVGTLAMVLGGVFLGGVVVRGITAMIEAFVLLRKAIQAGTIATIIMQAVATGGTSIAVAIATAAAGAAAGFAIFKGLEAALGNFDTSKIFDGIPGIDAINKDANSIYKDFKASEALNPNSVLDAVAQKLGGAKPGAAGGPGQGGVGGPMERTARATEELVSLKRRQMDIQAAAMGGGELARLGVSATEIGKSRAGGRDGEMLNQAVDLIAKHVGLVIAQREVANARARQAL